jgi:hypothetical protein
MCNTSSCTSPPCAPDPSKVDLTALKGIPHLFVWGDYLDQEALWQRITPNIDKFESALRAQGTDVTHIALPKQGIKGNSHMLMMNKNSDQIAAMIQKWMNDKGLMK